MISDVCSQYLVDNDLDKFLEYLKFYLNDKTFSKYYSGDVRTRCNWIILNPNSPQVYSQAKIILSALDTSSPLKNNSRIDPWEWDNANLD